MAVEIEKADFEKYGLVDGEKPSIASKCPFCGREAVAWANDDNDGCDHLEKVEDGVFYFEKCEWDHKAGEPIKVV